MKTFVGFLGAFVVGLCVGMTSMTFCPYLSKFVCQARCQADCCQKGKCCCEQAGKTCTCCPGCVQGKECTCVKCTCCPCCKGHTQKGPVNNPGKALPPRPVCPDKN